VGRFPTLAATVVVALALVAAGCGGEDEPETASTAVWAEGFCTAVTDWTDEIERIAGDAASSLSEESLREAADGVSTATDTFVEELQDLGAPDTESGQEIEDATQELTDAVEAEKADVEEAVEGASDTTEIAAALAVVGSSLQTLATALQSTLQAIEDADVSGELQTALEDSPACENLAD
jgi:methyl-accepting chemotaxis protein